MSSTASTATTTTPNRADAVVSVTRADYIKNAETVLNTFIKRGRAKFISIYREGIRSTARGDKVSSDVISDALLLEQNATTLAKRMQRIFSEFTVYTNGFQRLRPQTLTHAALERLVSYIFHINDIMRDNRNALSDLSSVHSFVNAYMNDHLTTVRVKAAELLASETQGIAPVLVRLAIKGLQLSTDLLCVSDTDTVTKLPGNEQIDTLTTFGLSYECAICNSILNEPIALTGCSHLTCRACAERTCEARKTHHYSCAICRAVTPNAMTCNTNNAVMRAISNFKIRCPLGCGKVLSIGTERREIVHHVFTDCTSASFFCTQCNQPLPSGLGEAAYVKHINRECSKRHVLCCGCGEEMPHDEMVQHMVDGEAPDFLNITWSSSIVARDGVKNANGRRPAPSSDSSAAAEDDAGDAAVSSTTDTVTAAAAVSASAQNKRTRRREGLTSTEAAHSHHDVHQICKKQFPCPNAAKGCRFILNDTTDPLELHLDLCHFRSLPCKYAHNGCTTQILPLEVDIHDEVCLYAELTCKFCGEKYLRGKAHEHFVQSEGVMPFSQQCVNQTKCENVGCEEYIAMYSTSGMQHRAECRFRLIRCDVCNEHFAFQDKPEHDLANVHYHDLIVTVKTTKEEVQTLKEQVKILQEMNRALKTEVASNKTALDVHTTSVMRTMRLISRPGHTSGFTASMNDAFSAAAHTEDPDANRRALVSSICESDIFAGEQRHSVMNRVGLFFSLNAFPAHFLTDLMEGIAESNPPPPAGLYTTQPQACLKVPAETAFTHAATGLRIHPIFVFGRAYAHMEMKIDMIPGHPTHPAIDDYEIECAYSMMRRSARGRCPITIQNTVPKKCVVTPARLPIYTEAAWRTFNCTEFVRPTALASAEIFTLTDLHDEYFRCIVRLHGTTIESDPIFKSDIGALFDWYKRDAPTRKPPTETRKREFLIIAVRILSIRKLGDPRPDTASASSATAAGPASSMAVLNSMETDDEGHEHDEY